MTPETRYARSGDVNIACQVVGQAPRDLALVPGWVSTDIVNATDRAAALGGRRWRDLLAGHHALVWRELARFRGREIDTAGDGFLAAFDGPPAPAAAPPRCGTRSGGSGGRGGPACTRASAR